MLESRKRRADAGEPGSEENVDEDEDDESSVAMVKRCGAMRNWLMENCKIFYSECISGTRHEHENVKPGSSHANNAATAT